MKSSVSVHVRVPLKWAQVMKRAAKRSGKKLATFVRDAAFGVASEVELREQERQRAEAMIAAQDAPRVGGL